jgi:hypothetical protein
MSQPVLPQYAQARITHDQLTEQMMIHLPGQAPRIAPYASPAAVQAAIARLCGEGWQQVDDRIVHSIRRITFEKAAQS